MNREYELFEQLPNGSPIWRGHASGLLNARLKLQELANKTKNECFAMHLPTKEVVARLNLGASQAAPGKRLIFQIAYDSKLATERGQILRLCGYEVVSVIGNEAAKVVLSMPHGCSLFIVGHGPLEEQRQEMVAWLKTKYAGVPILALNSPGIRELAGADYNARLNGPDTWMPLVAKALGPA